MAAISAQTALGSYASVGLNLSHQAASGGTDTFVATGRDLVIALNDDAGAQTVTITSQVTRFGRTGDITTHSIPAGQVAVFGPFKLEGWKKGDGNIEISASSVNVKFSVLRLER